MKVTYRLPDGSETVVDVPPYRKLLEYGESSGLELPYSCRSGNCSDCLGRLLSGQVDQSRGTYLSEHAKQLGFCLTCVAKPLTDCVLLTHQRQEARTSGLLPMLIAPQEPVGPRRGKGPRSTEELAG